LIAPASADLLARLAAGLCDDMLTSALLARADKPVLVAPAMNTDMWTHPATQTNRRTLEGYGYDSSNPASGASPRASSAPAGCPSRRRSSRPCGNG
jgi:phosphopantothenoylcysteine decarboxylase/phosphopantothenate--cysteine ligase